MRLVYSSALVLSACTSEAIWEEPIEGDFTVRPGVEQVSVLDAAPNTQLTLYSPEGDELVSVISDDAGQAHFAYVPPEPILFTNDEASRLDVTRGDVLRAGSGYWIEAENGDVSAPFRVTDVDEVLLPWQYEGQTLHGIEHSALSGPVQDPIDGFQYIRVRDGVLLSAMVRFPDPLLYGDGPYPTVVEYSGYSPSRPDRMDAGTRIANALGYATVSVNLRGTGCSGGVFDVFNKAQHADAYDVIEVVARQEWVLNHQVGMVGLSYPGITQLYAASTRPPSLAAAVPLSVLADPWEMQWPGGVYNKGFTRQWVEERESAAAANGSSWVVGLIEDGDTTCAENVGLSHLSIDFEEFLRVLEFRTPFIEDRDLNQLVRGIEAPVFFGGQFQDEQTGAQFGAMLDRFDNSPNTRFFLSNGRHPDGFSPDMVFRWFEFLEFHVAERVPELNGPLRTLGADQFAGEFGMSGYTFPDDRFAGMSYDDALAAYMSEPPVRVQFENGAGDASQPGAPYERFAVDLDAWPIEQPNPLQWYLGPDQTLDSQASSGDLADTWQYDPEAGSSTFFGPRGYQLLVPQWDLDWTRFDEGYAASYLTAPFSEDTIVTGPAIAELWLRSPEPDVTVQVTLTEVRPDGNEVLIQSGWLRVGHRAGSRASDLRIHRTYAEADFEPVPVGEWVQADVQIPSVAHPIREGSSLRMVVSTPGRDHGTWEFEDPAYEGQPVFELGIAGEHASRLIVGTLPGVDIPAGLPACNALRGQPCRPYIPLVNTPSDR